MYYLPFTERKGEESTNNLPIHQLSSTGKIRLVGKVDWPGTSSTVLKYVVDRGNLWSDILREKENECPLFSIGSRLFNGSLSLAETLRFT